MKAVRVGPDTPQGSSHRSLEADRPASTGGSGGRIGHQLAELDEMLDRGVGLPCGAAELDRALVQAEGEFGELMALGARGGGQ